MLMILSDVKQAIRLLFSAKGMLESEDLWDADNELFEAVCLIANAHEGIVKRLAELKQEAKKSSE